MKIIAGISNSHKAEEIEMYAKAGVDEFFVGYIPKEWSDEYGWELSNNRRETASYQYRNRVDIVNVVDLIHKQQRKVYLTVNAHEYNTNQTKLLVRILKNIEDIKFDGFIVSNIGILLELQRNGFNQEINISIGGGNNNIETLKFFKENFDNIGRLILPRKLTLSEIEKIAAYASEQKIRLEAFGMAAFCVFNDEFCFTWHGPSNKCFCQSPMFEFREVQPILFGDDWKDELYRENINTFYFRHNKIASEIKQQRDNSLKKPVPFGAKELQNLHTIACINKCGLCAFQKFKEWGIETIKLPLRGQDFKGNLAIIEITKKTINQANATPKFCQDLMSSPNFCSGSNCYYDYPYPK